MVDDGYAEQKSKNVNPALVYFLALSISFFAVVLLVLGGALIFQQASNGVQSNGVLATMDKPYQSP